jgi:hypothetical protein
MRHHGKVADLLGLTPIFFIDALVHATRRNVVAVKLLSFCFSSLLLYGQAYRKP